MGQYNLYKLDERTTEGYRVSRRDDLRLQNMREYYYVVDSGIVDMELYSDIYRCVEYIVSNYNMNCYITGYPCVTFGDIIEIGWDKLLLTRSGWIVV